MIEIHPFKPFIPKNAKYLLLGSFPGRAETRAEEWYYETARGQFWTIIRNLYALPLTTRAEKIELMSKLGIALSDVIYKCQRIKGNNSDINLKIVECNTKTIKKILQKNKIKKIYFSSKYVEKIFKSKFKDLIKTYPHIELIALPSSSPRYAGLSIQKKLEIYKKLMPVLHVP